MAKYITKIKEDVPTAKDRGGPGIYEEMIKTWVLYELVKVLYLFGLNPGRSDSCESAAPEIYKYLFDMEEGYATEESVELNSILFNLTKHKSRFSGKSKECTFANVSATTWVADVQYQIPFLILTWMRHLQEYFFEDENRRWNSLGRYAPTTKPTSDEKKNPLTAVYFTRDKGKKISQMRRLKQFTDILPQEPKDNKGNTVFTSLEEWAMLLFAPAVPKTLEKAMSEDSETKQRFEQMMTKTCDNNYVCIFTTKDYSGYGGQKAITYQPEQQQTTANYRDQEPHELHYALVKNFLIMKKHADKMIRQKNPQNLTTSYISLPT